MCVCAYVCVIPDHNNRCHNNTGTVFNLCGLDRHIVYSIRGSDRSHVDRSRAMGLTKVSSNTLR